MRWWVDISTQNNACKQFSTLKKQQNVREGNTYFPGYILKHVGHYFISFGWTQIEVPNQSFV